MSSLMQWMEDGSLRLMVKDGSEGAGDCERTRITFLAGSGVTDGGGYWKMDVAQAVCG